MKNRKPFTQFHYILYVHTCCRCYIYVYICPSNTMKCLIKTKNKMKLNETQATTLSVAIGHEVAKLLALKFKQGRTQTTWGTKSIEGLGACVQRIVEEQNNKIESK